MTPDIFHIRYLFHLLNFIGFSRCIREAGDTRAPHAANHLRQPPYDQVGELNRSDIARPTMALPIGRTRFQDLAAGSAPKRVNNTFYGAEAI